MKGLTVIQGNAVSENPLPPATPRPVLTLRGEFHGQPADFSLDEEALSKHLLLVGGTGCGKSTLFYHIISQLKRGIGPDDVMIIFDTKGDFHQKFFGPGDCVIGNSPQYAAQSERWNIFKEILADGWDDRRVQMNTQEICKALFEERVKGNGSNPFFPNAARDLLAAIFVAAIRRGAGNINYVRANFNNEMFWQFLNSCSGGDFCDFLEDYDDLRSVMSYIDGGTEQAQGVLAEMFSVARDVFLGVFAERGKFSIRQFVRKKGGRTLFLEYDLSIGSVLAPVYRLLFDSALKESLGRTQSQGNVFLICDEFKLLPHLQHIDDGVNFGRGLGVKVFAGLQSMEQLYELYGRSRGRNLAAGFSSMIAFRANDVTTREYVSSLYGKNIVLEQFDDASFKRREEKRMGYAVEDWDLNPLRVGEAVVGLPFTPPFRFYFERYRG